MVIATPVRDQTGEVATAAPKSLRTFLERLRQEHPEDIVRVSRRVNPQDYEVTAILEHLTRRDEHPLAVFENAQNMLGEPSEFPIVSNVFGTRQRCADALDFPRDQWKMPLSLEYARRVAQSVEPVVVDRSRAPVKDVVLRGDDVDIRKLPIVRHYEMDLSPVLTMAACMRDPLVGTYDITFTKLFPKGPRRAGASIHTADLERTQRVYEERGERAPFIAILGHHPAFYLGSLALTPYETDDYATVGSFLGEPLRLVPSETWGDRFMVPADAEIIIEGELPPGEQEVVDPFGDVTRQYQPQCLRPGVDITAITYRRDAIMQDIFSGHRGHWNLGGLPKEGSVYHTLQRRFGTIVGVHLPYSGCSRLACYVSMKKVKEGQGKLAGLAALMESWTFNAVVVVDDDVDPFNEEEVVWAALAYTNPTRDVDMVHNLYTVFTTGFGYRKVVIDATRPLDVAFPIKFRVPPDAMERVKNLDEWIERTPAAGGS